MPATFKRKLLLTLSQQKRPNGFTLIELLVTVIIVGILGAIALPSLLGQIGKARESEARVGIGTINRAQQVLHYETAQMILLGPPELASINRLGVSLEAEFYNFSTIPSGTSQSATTVAINPDATAEGTRNLAGAVGFNPATGQYTLNICVASVPGIVPDPAISAVFDEATATLSCGADFAELN